jgi:hypothetical protein
MARRGFRSVGALGIAALLLSCGSSHRDSEGGGPVGQAGAAAGPSSGGVGGTSNAGASNAGASNAGASNAGASNAGASMGGAVNSALTALSDAVGAYCTAVPTCCAGASTPVEDCKAMHAMTPVVASVMNGSVTIDLTALAKCKAAYGPGPDQCNLNVVAAACAGVYVGHRGIGEPCTNPFECDHSAGDAWCVIPDPAMNPAGTCQKAPRGNAGDACFASCRIGSDCSSTGAGASDSEPLCFESDGLYCDYNTRKCANVVTVGGSCFEEQQCGSEARCVVDTCKALGGVGTPCADGCRHELECDANVNCADPTWISSSACRGYPPGL